MADTAYELMDGVFKALGRGDREAVLAAFADDAVLFDPHYPRPLMRGKKEIGAGLDWGLGSMRSFSFDIRHYFPGEGGLSVHSRSIRTMCSRSARNSTSPRYWLSRPTEAR